MRKPRQHSAPSDYVTFESVLEHPRGELWDLLSQPELFPRFFRGVSSCSRIPSAEQDQATQYSLRATLATGEVVDYVLRTVTKRRHEKLVLAPVPESGSWASLTLRDARPGRTRVTIVLSKPDQARIHARKAEIQAWAREGFNRVADYLAGVPDGRVRYGRSYSDVQLRVGQVLFKSGIARPSHPVRGIRQLSRLGSWGFNLVGGYAQAAVRSPNEVALADDRGMLTFGELYERARRLAAGLAEKVIEPGTTVAVLARNHAALVESVVACGMLGVDVVLLNTGLAARQIEAIIEHHDVRALFTDDEFESVTQYLPPELLRVSTSVPTTLDRSTIDDVLRDAPENEVKPPSKQGKLVVLTSGTGGTPKGAKRPEPKGFSTIAAILSRLPLRTRDRMFIAAPVFHSWGLAALQISTPLRATVVLRDRFDAEECLRAISQHRCTSLFAVPIMLQRILNLPAEVRASYDTSSLRVVASSGSVLSGSLVTEFMDTFGDILYNFYGSTEVSQATVAGPADLRAAPTTAGHPALGTTVAILDPDGVAVPRGAVGRIFVGNEMLFDGYTDGESAVVKDTLMDTGDLGYLDAEGRLFVSGRDDEMIISGGENVFPRPVEEALAALPQVSEVAVVGVPDDEYGQRLAAFIVAKSGARLDASMVRSYIHHRLTRFSVPRDVTFLTRLPRNTTGKILKRLLVERSS